MLIKQLLYWLTTNVQYSYLKNSLNEELFTVMIVHMLKVFLNELGILFAVLIALGFLHSTVQ